MKMGERLEKTGWRERVGVEREGVCGQRGRRERVERDGGGGKRRWWRQREIKER